MELDLMKKIELIKNDLVIEAEKFLDNNPFNGKSTQLRNLSAIANSTLSTEVVKNFIKYQIGRKIDGWNEFGQKLIKTIDDLMKNDIKLESHDKAAEYKIAKLRLFIGYLLRYKVYQEATSTKGGK